MISKFFYFLGMMCKFFMVGIMLFLTFCMNVFTLPLYLLAYLFCKLVKLRTPRFAGYGLMVYPTWHWPTDSLLRDVDKAVHKEMKKVKKPWPVRPWEARFFR